MVGIDQKYLKEWQEGDLEHLRYDYDISENDLCLDLGSYKREWAIGMVKKHRCKVECFDALDNRAAWINDGVLSMGGAFYYTSLYDDYGVQEFRCVDIARFLQKEIGVMKINIEGGEYELLDYIIGKGLHKNVKNIQVQFHIIKDFPYEERYNNIKEKLNLTHKLTFRYPYVWENWQLI